MSAQNTATLAFEIGTEEIPAFDLDSAQKQLAKMAPAAFDEARIPYERIEVLGAPRRLIVMAYGMARETEALVEEHKGPSIAIAFDEAGNPTKAASGFARGKGVDVSELEVREVNGTSYVYAVKSIEATEVTKLLPEILTSFITNIKWPRSCKWASYRDYFVRPVRSILAMLGDEVIPMSFAGVTSSNKTAGHRVLAPGYHEVVNADDFLAKLPEIYVIASQSERERIIREGVAQIENETGLTARLPEKTLLEVMNLSEYPQPYACHFDEEFLDVPEEIIVDAMLMHQRYFPLYDASGKLTNTFIIVSNGDPEYAQTIIDGNERVVRARLDDAKFFFEEDQKKPLETYVERLDEVVFQESLGTVLDKTKRLVALSEFVADQAGLDDAARQDVTRAAYLAKADLVTNAVIEFTSVQGVMGSYYALSSGESPEVARAIAEHYRPRFAGDEAPSTLTGKLVAFVDKLDTICSLFAVNQAPTGSSDPFALRRSAIGIVGMLEDGLPVQLMPCIDESLRTLEQVEFDVDAIRAQIVEFFVTRTKVSLKDAGHGVDAIDAVLAADVTEPAQIIKRTHALEQARENDEATMNDLALAYARAAHLADVKLGVDPNPELFGASESALSAAISSAQAAVEADLARDDFSQALRDLAQLREPIDAFFEDVMVMDPDENLRTNRLVLLNAFVAVFKNVCDFGVLAKK